MVMDHGQKHGTVSSRPLLASLPLTGTYKQVMREKSHTGLETREGQSTVPLVSV